MAVLPSWLLLLHAPATADPGPHEGYRVALLAASSNPASHEDVVVQLMRATRAFGPPDGVVAECIDGPCFCGPGDLNGDYVCEEPGDSLSQDLPRASYELAQVDIFDLATATPRAEDLEDYEILFVYNDAAFLDPVAAGDAVATRVEQGAGLVLAGYAADPALGIEGRFVL